MVYWLLALQWGLIFAIGGIIGTAMDNAFPILCRRFGKQHPNLPTLLTLAIAVVTAGAFASMWFQFLFYLDRYQPF